MFKMSFSKRKLLPLATLLILFIGVGSFLLARSTESTATTNTHAATTHKDIIATIFWIGEPADESNAQISNIPTAWDNDTNLRFGGADGPSTPNGAAGDVARDASGIITAFRPLMNPYYFALPAAEFGDDGQPSEQAKSMSPWAKESVADGYSRFKGQWIKIVAGQKTAYAQWLDVGPNETDDYAYVFGKAKPKNSFGLRAGLDLSPATAFTLGFQDDSRQVSWQFVDASEVPDGPWKQYPAIDNKIYWE